MHILSAYYVPAAAFSTQHSQYPHQAFSLLSKPHWPCLLGTGVDISPSDPRDLSGIFKVEPRVARQGLFSSDATRKWPGSLQESYVPAMG